MLWNFPRVLPVVVHFAKQSERRPRPISLPLSHCDRDGEKFALASLYLGCLLVRLNECVANLVRFVGRYDIVTHFDSCFLKMFVR